VFGLSTGLGLVAGRLVLSPHVDRAEAAAIVRAVVPTSLALAGERYPRHAGTLFGLLLTCAQAGAMIMPALIGLAARRVGLRLALSLLVACGVAIAAATRRAHPEPRGTI
jgi:MFS family permease